MRKCPPGVVCVENVSMFFIAICLLLVVYLIYSNVNKNIQINNHPSEKIPRPDYLVGFNNQAGLIITYQMTLI